MDAIKKYWHWILAGSIFFCEAAVLLVLREQIYVGICDNLDLFITQLKMLRDQQAFFAHGQAMPILQGIDRNYFPSEFSLYNILYFLLPDIYAYIAGILLKMLLAMGSSILLAKHLLGAKYARTEQIVVLAAIAFALLPVYPMYAFCFASMPLVLYLLVRLYEKADWRLYGALFFYPLVSYFTFFGAFLLGYILIAVIVLSIRDKGIPWRLLGGFLALAAGYVCFEYRLFGIMFFSQTETIRSTMETASYNAAQLWHTFTEVLLHGFSHARSLHTVLVLPVCVVYFIWNNIMYIRRKQAYKIAEDVFNWTILFLVFNCAVYALYFWEPLRSLVETVLPPLKGFQYGRTIFFNPFAWYFAFFIVLRKIYQKRKSIACVLGLAAILIVAGTQCEYSDFYNTIYCNLYKLVKHTEGNQLSYGEFYGKDLINQIKEDIGYTPDKGACAYGMHPAMLSYNGITTIDGYCGYYPQEYKEAFREAIAPTLDANENWQTYYDTWGCRAYLFSASGENTYDFGANAKADPQEILMDADALKRLGCDYIFSRVEITNAEQMGLTFIKEYHCEGIPYDIYLYKL